MVSTFAFWNNLVNPLHFTIPKINKIKAFQRIVLILSLTVLFAALWSIMLSATPDNLFAQVAVMFLACPATQVIIISNLLRNSK